MSLVLEMLVGSVLTMFVLLSMIAFVIKYSVASKTDDVISRILITLLAMAMISASITAGMLAYHYWL